MQLLTSNSGFSSIDVTDEHNVHMLLVSAV